MKFSKKYVLLDQDSYNRLNDISKNKPATGIFTHPDVKTASEERDEMNSIAADDSLSDFQKLQLHSQSLKKFLDSFKSAQMKTIYWK